MKKNMTGGQRSYEKSHAAKTNQKSRSLCTEETPERRSRVTRHQILRQKPNRQVPLPCKILQEMKSRDDD